jgi:hypothetical protein
MLPARVRCFRQRIALSGTPEASTAAILAVTVSFWCQMQRSQPWENEERTARGLWGRSLPADGAGFNDRGKAKKVLP